MLCKRLSEGSINNSQYEFAFYEIRKFVELENINDTPEEIGNKFSIMTSLYLDYLDFLILDEKEDRLHKKIQNKISEFGLSPETNRFFLQLFYKKEKYEWVIRLSKIFNHGGTVKPLDYFFLGDSYLQTQQYMIAANYLDLAKNDLPHLPEIHFKSAACYYGWAVNVGDGSDVYRLYLKKARHLLAEYFEKETNPLSLFYSDALELRKELEEKYKPYR